jgi:hypothetical protein
MANVSAPNLDLLLQPTLDVFIKMEVLDLSYFVVGNITGNVVSANFSIDAESDLRRTCNLEFVVTGGDFKALEGGYIWLNRMVRPYIGYLNQKTGEIEWYNQGLYVVNSPTYTYDATTATVSFQGLDLMSKLTGLRGGAVEGITTVIKQGENVRDAIISILNKFTNFEKYYVAPCADSTGAWVNVPYDITISEGQSVWDLLKQLRDMQPNYQMYFDINGVFIYEPLPSLTETRSGDMDTVQMDDSVFDKILVSESSSIDFESVKNYVEVFGRNHDYAHTTPYGDNLVSYLNDFSANIIYDVVDGKPSDWNDETVLIVVTRAAPVDPPIENRPIAIRESYSGVSSSLINTRTIPVVDNNDNPVLLTSEQIQNGFQMVLQLQGATNSTSTTTDNGNVGTFVLLGTGQAHGVAYDNNPSSPFYIGEYNEATGTFTKGTIEPLRIVLSGGEYDNIMSDYLAEQRALYELYHRCRTKDEIALSVVPVPWAGVNTFINHKFFDTGERNTCVIKKINATYGEQNNMTITASVWYPYYPYDWRWVFVQVKRLVLLKYSTVEDTKLVLTPSTGLISVSGGKLILKNKK